MFKKIILLAILMIASTQTAEARGGGYGGYHGGYGGHDRGYGWDIGLGILGGIAIGSALAYPYPYYYDYYSDQSPIYQYAPQYQPAPVYVQQTCRQYQQNIIVNGYMQQIYGTACLMSDGQWHAVN